MREKAEKARKLQERYTWLRQNNEIEESFKIEREYLSLRKEIVDEVTREVAQKRAVPLSVIKQQVRNKPKKPPRETGITVLDKELVETKRYGSTIGGISLGNYIQIAGSRGAGKTSLILKIVTQISLYENVVWFDFEMGERRFTEKVEDFTHDDTKLQYYNASRSLGDIIDEIKVQYASGVRQFVIDSAMKIYSNGDRYEQYSGISKALSELTSTLEINIWMINQMSQSAERDGFFAIKHGNDAEYDADFIFFIVVPIMEENGKTVKDEFGYEMDDNTKRVIYCTKNRQDDRTFHIEIRKEDIFGWGKSVEGAVEEHTYKMPKI